MGQLPRKYVRTLHRYRLIRDEQFDHKFQNKYPA